MHIETLVITAVSNTGVTTTVTLVERTNVNPGATAASALDRNVFEQIMQDLRDKETL